MSKGTEILASLSKPETEYKMEVHSRFGSVKGPVLAVTMAVLSVGMMSDAFASEPVDFGRVAKAVISSVTPSKNVHLNIYNDTNPSSDLKMMDQPKASSLITKDGKEVCNVYLGRLDASVGWFYDGMSPEVQATPGIGKAITEFIVAHEAMHCVQGLSVNTVKHFHANIKGLDLQKVNDAAPDEVPVEKLISLFRDGNSSFIESYADTGALVYMQAKLTQDAPSLSADELKSQSDLLKALSQGILEMRTFNAGTDHQHITSGAVERAVKLIHDETPVAMTNVGRKAADMVAMSSVNIYSEVAQQVFSGLGISTDRVMTFVGNTDNVAAALKGSSIPDDMDVNDSFTHKSFYGM